MSDFDKATTFKSPSKGVPSLAEHSSFCDSTLKNAAQLSRKLGLKTKIKILKGKWLLERTTDETRMLRAYKQTKHGMTAEEFAEKW